MFRYFLFDVEVSIVFINSNISDMKIKFNKNFMP